MAYNKIKPLIAVDSDIPFLSGRLEEHFRVRYLNQGEFTPETVRDADGMIIRTRTKCDRNLLEGSSVKVIATATIGMDQFNLQECDELGIRTFNAPGCNAPGVSQYVWSCLLRLGVNPEKSVIGIVGAGNVGSIVAEWGKNLGATILLNDPPKAEKEGQENSYMLIEDMIPQCDVVTVHTPMIRDGRYPTFHLIGEREIELMRPGTVVVNAARGPVTDTRALCHGIMEKGIRAVIDCWEGEPDVDRELLRLAEIATYHIAGYSLEGKQRATSMAVSAIASFFGVNVDVSDLPGPYSPGRILTAQQIYDSYNPMPQMKELLASPDQFDKLRAAYEYRKEP